MRVTRRRSPPKEASPVVTIEGERVRAVVPEGPEAEVGVAELFDVLAQDRPSSGELVLPDGVRSMVPTRHGFLLVHESPPALHRFRWITNDSESDFGPGTEYREVTLALPFVVVFAVFLRAADGRVQLGIHNECFFSARPLARRGMDTPLCYPALLNCSRFPDAPGNPLSWICTQHLSRREYVGRDDFASAVNDGLGALLRHLLESGFNRSSEHHELSSWFAETVRAGLDPRLASVEAWEAASAQDPSFVREVPWLPTGKTLREVIEHVQRRNGGAAPRISSARDLSRAVIHQAGRARRSRRTRRSDG